MLPDLISRFPEQYVAIHDGRVVGSGGDPKRLALDAYARHGYVAVFVGLASVLDGPNLKLEIYEPSA